MFEKFTADNIRKWEESKNIDELIKTLRYKDKEIQNLASLALQRIGEEAVEELIKALGSANIQLRSNATKVLVSIGNVAVERLIQYLRDEAFSGIFPEIARVLGSIGDEKAIEALAEKLNDEDVRVRGVAVDALEKIGTPKAEEILRHHRGPMPQKAGLKPIKGGLIAALVIFVSLTAEFFSNEPDKAFIISILYADLALFIRSFFPPLKWWQGVIVFFDVYFVSSLFIGLGGELITFPLLGLMTIIPGGGLLCLGFVRFTPNPNKGKH